MKAGVLIALLSMSSADADWPSVDEIIAKLEANVALQAARATTEVTTTRSEGGFLGKDARWSRERTEYRSDGARFSLLTTVWSDIQGRHGSVDEAKGYQRRVVWDGIKSTEYHPLRAGEGTPFVVVGRDPDLATAYVATGYRGAPLDGRFPGDTEDIVSILKEAPSVRVKKRMEDVANVASYAIEAVGRTGGAYTIFVDPTHGYNINKAVVVKRGDDTWRGEKLSKPITHHPNNPDGTPGEPKTIRYTEALFLMDHVEFSRKGPMWIPIRARYVLTRSRDDGVKTTAESFHERTSIVSRPDFPATAFVADIPNGTRAFERGTHLPIALYWFDGKLRPSASEVDLTDLDRVVADLLTNDGRDTSARPSTAPSQSYESGDAVRGSTTDRSDGIAAAAPKGGYSFSWLHAVVMGVIALVAATAVFGFCYRRVHVQQ